jgi:hypothetical protein
MNLFYLHSRKLCSTDPRFNAKNIVTFDIGDICYVEKKKGRAVVLTELQDGGKNQEVEFLDSGKRVRVSPRKLRRVYAQHGVCSIVICEETEEYRRLARTQITSLDAVIEIGCSTGECSAVLANSRCSLIALDISADIIAHAKVEHPGIHFLCLDALKDWERLVELQPHATSLFIDIGGNRALESLAGLLTKLRWLPKLSLVVLKNRDIYNSARRAQTVQSCCSRDTTAASPFAQAPPTVMASSSSASGSSSCSSSSSTSSSITSSSSTSSSSTSSSSTSSSSSSVHRYEGILEDSAAWWSNLVEYWNKVGLERDEERCLAAAKTMNDIAPDTEVKTSSSPPVVGKPRLRSVWEAAYFAARAASGVSQGASSFLDPRKAPDRWTADGKKICRFHNYASSQCSSQDACPLDHESCHYCGEKGHVALRCRAQSRSNGAVNERRQILVDAEQPPAIKS